MFYSYVLFYKIHRVRFITLKKCKEFWPFHFLYYFFFLSCFFFFTFFFLSFFSFILLTLLYFSGIFLLFVCTPAAKQRKKTEKREREREKKLLFLLGQTFPSNCWVKTFFRLKSQLETTFSFSLSILFSLFFSFFLLFCKLNSWIGASSASHSRPAFGSSGSLKKKWKKEGERELNDWLVYSQTD